MRNNTIMKENKPKILKIFLELDFFTRALSSLIASHSCYSEISEDFDC